MDRCICTHYLSNKCAYGEKCKKLHPSDKKQAIIEYNNKGVIEICQNSTPHDSSTCDLIHIKTLDPDVEKLVIDNQLESIGKSYSFYVNKYTDSGDKEEYTRLLGIKDELEAIAKKL